MFEACLSANNTKLPSPSRLHNFFLEFLSYIFAKVAPNVYICFSQEVDNSVVYEEISLHTKASFFCNKYPIISRILPSASPLLPSALLCSALICSVPPSLPCPQSCPVLHYRALPCAAPPHILPCLLSRPLLCFHFDTPFFFIQVRLG